MPGHRLEQTAHRGPAGLRYVGAHATAPRRGPARRRRGVVESSCIAISMKLFLGNAPVKAVNSAMSWKSAKAGRPAQPYASWDKATKRHTSVAVRPYLSRFKAFLPLADTAVSQAAATTAGAQAGVSRTRPQPLANQDGTGGGHRVRGRAVSAARSVLYRRRRWSVRRQQHRGCAWGLGVGGEATTGVATAAATPGEATELTSAGAEAAEQAATATSAEVG